ncbi:hypothetical protein CPB84DRAFT_1786364 [Gymnopilus junonius]|uniref:Uncharacterized protein n=1 Tax=Gymnopilus junonius TaxID=109634 RepID=A0A9P5NID2_GYMJU|nr:hypothetical protein CPB84DRAFT_1786364 [Gymnopilus junonius]
MGRKPFVWPFKISTNFVRPTISIFIRMIPFTPAQNSCESRYLDSPKRTELYPEPRSLHYCASKGNSVIFPFPDYSIMETVASDPELASEMLALMNKELKSARLRIKELESRACSEEVDIITYIHRTEAAEKSLEIAKADLMEMSSENQLLRAALEDLRDSKKVETMGDDLQAQWSKETRDQSVSATDQSSSDTDGHTKELESALEKYYGKYKTEKLERKELKNTCKMLEEQLSHLKEESNRRCLEEEAFVIKHKELEHQEFKNEASLRISSVVDSQAVAPSLKKVLSRKEVVEYMLKFPKVDHRPRYNTLRPVYHSGMDLKKYLAADKRTSACSANFLFLPGLFAWCPKVHHAFAIGPVHIFESKKGRWIEKSIFESLYDKTFSLFYKYETGTYYAGTYKAIKLLDFARADFKTGKFLLRAWYALDATLPGEKNNGRQPSLVHDTVRQLYLDGVLKVEPLGLQCVAFDHGLYAGLKDRYEKLAEVAYYPEDAEQDRPQKKQRTE